MTSEEHALLAAIVSGPADDAARLAYADWLDEHGRPGRAEFIRVQIEAERHHPDSARRRELNDRAEALFVEHGFRWWVEVCDAVGLPAPQSVATDRDAVGAEPLPPEEVPNFNLYRQACVYWTAPGWNVPGQDDWNGYRARGCTVQANDTFGLYYRPPGVGGFENCEFRRGFPDRLKCLSGSYHGDITYTPAALKLPRWAAACPLTGLSLESPQADAWRVLDGPHLARLARLELINPTSGVLAAVRASPHLSALQTLLVRLWHDDFTDYQPAREWYAGELADFFRRDWCRRLRQLFVALPTLASAEALAGGTGLTGLTGLWVDLRDIPMGNAAEPAEALARRLGVLARSPSLGGLRELGVTGHPVGLGDVANGTFGASLRKLRVMLSFAQPAGNLDPTAQPDTFLDGFMSSHASRTAGYLAPLARPDAFPALEELRVWLVGLNGATMRMLRTAPAVRRLRHLLLNGFLGDADPRELIELVDPERIETLRFELNDVPPKVARALKKRFGTRVSVTECSPLSWHPREPI